MPPLRSGRVHVKSECADIKSEPVESQEFIPKSNKMPTDTRPLSPLLPKPPYKCHCSLIAIQITCVIGGRCEDVYICPRSGAKDECDYRLDSAMIRAAKLATLSQGPTNTPLPERSPPFPSFIQDNYICHCGQPAMRLFCRNGRPENINKYYYVCAFEEKNCTFWEWIESPEDRNKRENLQKRPSPYSRPTINSPFKCHCELPALRLIAKNGMPHNIGRGFYQCRRKKCDFWVWEDGSLPFSEASQKLFNEYMDARLFQCEDWM